MENGTIMENQVDPNTTSALRENPLTTDFNLDGPVEPLTEESTEPPMLHKDPSLDLLAWHCKYSHISMRRMQEMAKNGMLPIRLSSCRIPICQSCTFGKMTKRPWRTKAIPSKGSRTLTTPGQTVSVDQLESHVDGFIGQLKGALTKERYKVATIFVDHYSNYSFVYLQHSTGAEETVKAKLAFESKFCFLLKASFAFEKQNLLLKSKICF